MEYSPSQLKNLMTMVGNELLVYGPFIFSGDPLQDEKTKIARLAYMLGTGILDTPSQVPYHWVGPVMDRLKDMGIALPGTVASQLSKKTRKVASH